MVWLQQQQKQQQKIIWNALQLHAHSSSHTHKKRHAYTRKLRARRSVGPVSARETREKEETERNAVAIAPLAH